MRGHLIPVIGLFMLCSLPGLARAAVHEAMEAWRLPLPAPFGSLLSLPDSDWALLVDEGQTGGQLVELPRARLANRLEGLEPPLSLLMWKQQPLLIENYGRRARWLPSGEVLWERETPAFCLEAGAPTLAPALVVGQDTLWGWALSGTAALTKWQAFGPFFLRGISLATGETTAEVGPFGPPGAPSDSELAALTASGGSERRVQQPLKAELGFGLPDWLGRQFAFQRTADLAIMPFDNWVLLSAATGWLLASADGKTVLTPRDDWSDEAQRGFESLWQRQGSVIKLARATLPQLMDNDATLSRHYCLAFGNQMLTVNDDDVNLVDEDAMDVWYKGPKPLKPAHPVYFIGRKPGPGALLLDLPGPVRVPGEPLAFRIAWPFLLDWNSSTLLVANRLGEVSGVSLTSGVARWSYKPDSPPLRSDALVRWGLDTRRGLALLLEKTELTAIKLRALPEELIRSSN